VAMYPVDTVKTRMQALPTAPGQLPPGALQTLRSVLQENGVSGLMRGCFAIGVGCLPAHVGLFCTYEAMKAQIMDLEHVEHQPVHAAACGVVATVVHDTIIVPTDVVKQRLQLGCYSGTYDCIKSVWRKEGFIAFYRSLPTTLLSECPFHGVLVATNESMKVLLNLESRGEDRDDRGPKAAVGWHFFSTGISGILAAVATQPLDVVKTRLQTQGVFADMAAEAEPTVRYSGMMSAARLIYKEEGLRGLFRGTVPRLLFAAPSAAMCWGTYEVVKSLLKRST
jgi:solute carrier family 25 iron transporter 28/37